MINDNIIIYFTAFFIGISSSIHCIGMCGSIVILFSIKSLKKKKKIIILYNFGRIISYSIIGIIGGFLGSTIFNFINKDLSIYIIKILNGIIIIFFGLYLMDFFKKLNFLKNKNNDYYFTNSNFFPIESYHKAIFIGILWGLIPCGLIYSIFLWSLNSESIIKSLLIMTSFGLGTMPSMIFFEYSIYLSKNIKKYKKVFNFLLIIIGFLILFNTIILNKNCH